LLVLVHKDFLLDQWIERIEKFVPDAKIGVMKAKKLDYENKDIVITTMQSLITEVNFIKS
jgi:superfamily II DNA or RNA helicase